MLGEEEAYRAIKNVLVEEPDAILNRNNDFFIAAVGEILTQNE